MKQRRNAKRNENAHFRDTTISREDYLNARFISDPLCLFDCDIPIEGFAVFVLTSAERARDLRQPPALITAAAQGATFDGEMMTSYYRDDLPGLPAMGGVAPRLWSPPGFAPAALATPFLSVPFTPLVPRPPAQPRSSARAEA